MKLQELDNSSQVKKIAKIMESYFGNNFKFNKLSPTQANKMLQRVRGMIREERASSNLHTSERNPAYLKLIMMEQALQARLKEYVQGQQQTGPAEPIVRGGSSEAVAQARQARSGMTGTTMSPPGQVAGTVIRGGGTKESMAENKKKKKIREASELQQAQVVLASQDMIDQIQGMLEDVSEMQFKDLPALIDQAKSEVGQANATQFQQAATEALTALLQSLQQGKTAMEGAQGALTGQAPAPIPGAEAGAMPGAEAGAMPGAEAGAMPGAEMPPGEELPPEPEPAPSGKALGRGRR